MAHTVADLVAFASRLDEASIRYDVGIYRDAVMFMITVPGERWEIEFLVDGTVEVEVFTSDGTVSDASTVDALFARHGGLARLMG